MHSALAEWLEKRPAPHVLHVSLQDSSMCLPGLVVTAGAGMVSLSLTNQLTKLNQLTNTLTKTIQSQFRHMGGGRA